MIRLILVEDQDQQAQKIGQLCRGILEELSEREPWMWCRYRTAEEVLLEEEDIDIALVDIELGSGLNGIELVQRLRQRHCPAAIVFLTNNASAAVKGYGLGVLAFVEKTKIHPALEEALLHCLQTVKRRRKKIFLPQIGPILVEKLLCIQADDKYLISYIENHEEDQEESWDTAKTMRKIPQKKSGGATLSHVIQLKAIRLSMKEAQKITEPYGLCRCHYSWMVNMRKVRSWKEDRVLLSWGQCQIPLSRTYAGAFREAYNRMLFEEMEGDDL